MGWTQLYQAFPAKPVSSGIFLVLGLGCLLGALAPIRAADIIGYAVSGSVISGIFVSALTATLHHSRQQYTEVLSI